MIPNSSPEAFWEVERDSHSTIDSDLEDRIYAQLYYTSITPVTNTISNKNVLMKDTIHDNDSKYSIGKNMHHAIISHDIESYTLPIHDVVLLESTDNVTEHNQITTEQEDIQSLEPSYDRYYLGNSGPMCFNCGESGHLNKDCPQEYIMPCYLCGTVGHLRQDCPQEVCFKCLHMGHLSRNCRFSQHKSYRDSKCRLCQYPEHRAEECTLNWRSYYSRSIETQDTEKKLIDGKITRTCYYCSSKGHFGDDCPQRRQLDYTAFHDYSIEYIKYALRKFGPPSRMPITTDSLELGEIVEEQNRNNPKYFSSHGSLDNVFEFKGDGKGKVIFKPKRKT